MQLSDRGLTDMNEAVRVSVADPNHKRFTAEKNCSNSCSQDANNSCCKSNDTESVALVPRPIRPSGKFLNQIPEDILQDSALNEAISALPANYNFEVHKCVWHIRKSNVKRVALQLPEGFQRYALLLSDILVRFGGCESAVILADVAYGACCIDDFTAELLGCELMIHYGHSCLIPITTTKIPAVYVFVEITIPAQPLLAVIKEFFADKKIALMATVQYLGVLHAVKLELSNAYIPQIKPLSPGEVLGCTAPKLPVDLEALIFIADGRFHLEAAMIANPSLPAYRYDPFTKAVFEEQYEHSRMLRARREMINSARQAQHFGVILGTLGRQGSPAVLTDLTTKLTQHGRKVTVVLMSEVRPEKLAQFTQIEAWVQTSCPRLSIDWNYAFGDTPLLTPYELNVLLGEAEPFTTEGTYPMDFYATGDSAHKSGPWTPGYHLRPPRKSRT